MRHPSLIRAQAAQACVDRFNGRALNWGKVDCAQIVLHNLRKLGISTTAWKGLDYKSEIGAAKVLRARGFDGLCPGMDAFEGLFRIAPAMASMGDVIGLEAAGGLWDCALAVRVSPQHVLGLHEGVVMALEVDLTHAVAAWRCNPCRT